MFVRFLFLNVLCFLFLSCGGPGAVQTAPPSPDQKAEEGPEPPPIKRRNPKEPDPVKQAACSKNRQIACEGGENCEDVCDDIFSRRRDKQDCYELPESLVFEFEELLDYVEDGDVDEIDSRVLECLLDIDETEFARRAKKMSRREAKDFLAFVANDDELAEILEDEDDEYNILKQVLNKATGSNNLSGQLEEEIDDDKSFLWLAGEGSEFVWDWLNDYVGDVCDKSNSESVCPGGENIGAYCKVLLDFKKSDLEDFLSEADFFANEYEDELEDDDYLYEVDDSPGSRYTGDFRDFCRAQIASGCPNSNGDLPEDQKLADITFDVSKSSIRDYTITGGYCHQNNAGETERFRAAIGSASRTQQIILRLNDYSSDSGELFLKESEIASYSADKTYYLYVNGVRYELGESAYDYTGDCGSGHPTHGYKIRRWEGFLPADFDFPGAGPYPVYLASEEDDGLCEYYQ